MVWKIHFVENNEQIIKDILKLQLYNYKFASRYWNFMESGKDFKPSCGWPSQTQHTPDGIVCPTPKSGNPNPSAFRSDHVTALP